MINWIQFIRNVFLSVYIVEIVLLVRLVCSSNISSITCSSCLFVEYVEYLNYVISYTFDSWLSNIIYIALFINNIKIARLVTLSLSLNIYVSKALLYFLAKSIFVSLCIIRKICWSLLILLLLLYIYANVACLTIKYIFWINFSRNIYFV